MLIREIMAKSRFWSHPAVQIFIACLIPNLGGTILFFALADNIKENKKDVKSFLEPPDWVVPVAWCILYTLSGFASWRVWKIGREKAKIPLLFYVILLLLNWLWPLIAFGLGSLLGAIIDAAVLQVFVVLTGVAFYRIDKLAGLFLVPYFVYLCYVLVLCSDIYILNN